MDIGQNISLYTCTQGKRVGHTSRQNLEIQLQFLGFRIALGYCTVYRRKIGADAQTDRHYYIIIIDIQFLVSKQNTF